MLSSLVPHEVAEFFRLREQYIRRIEERRSTHNERINATSLLLSVESKTLKMICRLGIRDAPEEEVTDDHLERYLKSLLKPNDTVVDVEGVFRRSLKMDLSIKDANARVMQFFIDFDDKCFH